MLQLKMKPKKGNASTSKMTKPPAKKPTKKTTTTSRPTTKKDSRKRVGPDDSDADSKPQPQ